MGIGLFIAGLIKWKEVFVYIAVEQKLYEDEAERDRKISIVRAITACSRSDAISFLNKYRWDEAKLLLEYKQSPETFYSAFKLDKVSHSDFTLSASSFIPEQIKEEKRCFQCGNICNSISQYCKDCEEAMKTMRESLKMNIKCANCGAICANNLTYCVNCGSKL
ncbi:MAG: hypothetical protein BWY64_01994 [bacterium ADurb.Bin363]|nr:MAG: hypothetical protein BWY64_01994 [bacterium ADurb.Bin363]